MKNKIKPLSLTVGITSLLIIFAALLMVLGIFDEWLKWDIFSPKTEAFLTAVFASSVALASFGFVLTFVLGTREIVNTISNIKQIFPSTSQRTSSSKKNYFLAMLLLFLILCLIVGSFHFANRIILLHRNSVFKKVAKRQMVQFEKRIFESVSHFQHPPRSNVPVEFHDLFRTIENLSYVSKATIYIQDTSDKSAMWGYRAWRWNGYKTKDGFARFFIAKDFEIAMRKAIDDNSSELIEINKNKNFEWYFPVKGESNKVVAIVRIDGNKKEDFREYKLGL